MSDRERGSHEPERESDTERHVAGRHRDSSVGVTQFFRDESLWDTVAARILPAITGQKQPGDAIRIWVPGCSTGEEAYSLAIVLAEHLGDALTRHPIRIFATDTDSAALESARRGVFSASIGANVSPPRLQRFFRPQDAGYEIEQKVRTLVLFAKQDVTLDPPFSRLDLVSCRNLLIYLPPHVQKDVLQSLHFGLSPSGYLILGGAETAGELPEQFSTVDAKLGVYLKRGRSVPAALRIAPMSSGSRATIEGLECANEQLQSTVEQLHGSNEELQATNEALCTARDELQATNDELSDSIDALEVRTAELLHSHDDVVNVLDAVGVGVVLVALDGKIRRLNDEARRLLELSPSAIGLPLARLAKPLGPHRLEAIVRTVVDRLVPFDGEVPGSEGGRYRLRVLPYKTSGRAIRGAVISLAEVALPEDDAIRPRTGAIRWEPS
jgi:two-component system CheB/CheR fusion protein